MALPTRISAVAINQSNNTSNPGAQNITVPADATGVLVFFSWWGNFSDRLLNSLTASFVSGGFTIRQLAASNAGAGKIGVGVAYGRVTATGEQTITPVWDWGTDAGPTTTLVFYKDIPPTGDWVRQTGSGDTNPRVWQDTTGSSLPSGTIPSTTEDEVLAFDSAGGSNIPGNPSGWTSIITHARNGIASRLRRANSPGASTTSTSSQLAGYATLAMASVMGVSGGGGSVPTVNVTSTVIEGQYLTVSGTYTEGVDSATITVPVGSPANGAVAVGPSSFGGFAAGVFSVTVGPMTPGSYGAPVIAMTNANGTGNGSGSAFEVLGIDGEPEAPSGASITEVLTTSDAQNTSTASTKSTTETTATGDSPSRVLGVTSAMTESSATADSPTRSISAASQQNEASVTGDSPSATAAKASSAAEASVTGDSPSGTASATTNQAETTITGDSPQGIVDTTLVNTTETTATSDATGRSLGGEPFQLETVNGADSQQSSAQLVVDTAEGISFADTPNGVRATLASQAEAVAPADAQQTFAVTGVLVLDLLGALEAISGEVSVIAGDVVEAVMLTDEQYRQLALAGAINELAAPLDAGEAMVLTGTTVFEDVSVQDVTRLLKYPYPRGNGPYVARRFRIRYR